MSETDVSIDSLAGMRISHPFFYLTSCWEHSIATHCIAMRPASPSSLPAAKETKVDGVFLTREEGEKDRAP